MAAITRTSVSSASALVLGIHHAPHGRIARQSLVYGVVAGVESSVRIRLAKIRVPVVGNMGGGLSRQSPPWNGETLTRGMEFGVSPFAETRRQMIDRNSLFGVPAYRWIPGGTKATVQYSAFLYAAPAMPEEAPI